MPFVKHTYITAEYQYVEKVIKEHFGLTNRWSFPQDQESWNDTWTVLTVVPKQPDEWEQENYIDKLKAGKQTTYAADTILNLLCYEGVIEPGEYLISICW